MLAGLFYINIVSLPCVLLLVQHWKHKVEKDAPRLAKLFLWKTETVMNRKVSCTVHIDHRFTELIPCSTLTCTTSHACMCTAAGLLVIFGCAYVWPTHEVTVDLFAVSLSVSFKPYCSVSLMFPHLYNYLNEFKLVRIYSNDGQRGNLNGILFIRIFTCSAKLWCNSCQ